MNKYIIHQDFGGLGDNLQFSTIPELCYHANISCFISDKNVYRNPEIKELVWDCNPYVNGYSPDVPNAGSCRHPGGYRGASSIVDAMEDYHGFGFKNHLPIIYYYPKIKKEFSDKTIIDFSAISAKDRYNDDSIKYITDDIQNKQECIVIKSKKNSFNYYSLNQFEQYQFNDIFEYCDLIYSCKKFLCLDSGGQVLASAISRFKANIDVECWLPVGWNVNFNIGMYFFKPIKYKNIIM